MTIRKENNISVAIVEADDKVNSLGDISDLMANAYYNHCVGLLIKKEMLGNDFFDLRTGYAGQILQKFSNYKMKIAIVGDFSGYKSDSLNDFIYECNNGSQVFFKGSNEEGLSALFSSCR